MGKIQVITTLSERSYMKENANHYQKNDQRKELLEKKVKELQEIRETLVLTLGFIDRVEGKYKKEKST